AKTAQSREENFQLLQALKRQSLPDELDRDMLDYFSQWYHPIIWELVGTTGFQADVSWISKKIIPHVKPALVQESLELLLKLDLITFDSETNTYRQTKNRVSTGHRIKGLALVSYHASMIDHAKTALTSVSGKRRDVSAVTVSVSEETALKLRSMIHAFQLQLLDEAERSGEGDQVYQINIQLFPFTE
ncbi:MAG: TIGR02147 family protein, partial [Proteobacteria bacterium]